MEREVEIALRNYDALVREKGLDEVHIDWETGTLVYGDGGTAITELLRPGFVDPATEGL